MKLKATLDTLDGVDEALKAAYTEKDGKFYLNIEGFDSHFEVAALRNSMRNTKQEKQAAEARATAAEERLAGLPDDFTPDKYLDMLDSGKTADIDKRLADQKDRLARAEQVKVTALQDKLDAATKKADRLYSDNAIMSAMSEAGITLPHAQKAVKAMFKEQVKVEYEGDDAIVTIDNMPVSDKLKAYAQSDEGKFFVSAANNSGGGANGGNGGKPPADNPWAKGTPGFNLTRQTEIERSDPNLATQLKAQAGVR